MKSAESVTSASGVVSHLEKQSRTVGYSDGFANTRIRTSFRLNGTPICFRGSPHIGDGDSVKVIGYFERGILDAEILCNHTTGVRYGTVFNADGRLAYVLGIGCLALGIFFVWPFLSDPVNFLEYSATNSKAALENNSFIFFLIAIGSFLFIRRCKHDQKVLRLINEDR